MSDLAAAKEQKEKLEKEIAEKNEKFEKQAAD